MSTSAAVPERVAPSPWSARARTANARRLLVAGLVGAHVSGITAVGIMVATRGPAAAATAAIAAVVVIAFFTIGHGVQVAYAEADPRRVLVASLASYLLRVTALGLLLALAMRSERLAAILDPVALFTGAITALLGWIAFELNAYRTLRFPVYDTEYVPPTERGGRR